MLLNNAGRRNPDGSDASFSLLHPTLMHAKIQPIPPAARTVLDTAALTRSALTVIETEAHAISLLKTRIDGTFLRACELMFECAGRIVVSGMGKSGHVARKIAATLASTGTPAFFVHPAEASHGDLGMITQRDVVLALSNSGETDELLAILPLVKRQGVPLILMTGKPDSSLATMADVHIDVSVPQEACPLGLAPTASTTAMLVMGDALAIAMLEARGFTDEDFARSHPAGSLGRRLLLHISDIMHTGEQVPMISADASLVRCARRNDRQGSRHDRDRRARNATPRRHLHRRRPAPRGRRRRYRPARDAGHATDEPPPEDHRRRQARGRSRAPDGRPQDPRAARRRCTAGSVVGALNIHDLLRARVV